MERAVVVNTGGIGPDPECLIAVDQHTMDGVMAECSFRFHIHVDSRDGHIAGVQDVESPEGGDQYRIFAEWNKMAYGVVVEARVTGVEASECFVFLIINT